MADNYLFTVKDLADILGIKTVSVANLIRLGKIKASMQNRRIGYRITKEDFKEYCKNRGLNFEELIKKYEFALIDSREPIKIRTPQDNNSIFEYPPHPYHMHYDSTFLSSYYDTKLKIESKINMAFSTESIGKEYGIEKHFNEFLEQLGYLMFDYGKYKPHPIFFRFGLVTYHLNKFYWTHIGKRFLQDQLEYEYGFIKNNTKNNCMIVEQFIFIEK